MAAWFREKKKQRPCSERIGDVNQGGGGGFGKKGEREAQEQTPKRAATRPEGPGASRVK